MFTLNSGNEGGEKNCYIGKISLLRFGDAGSNGKVHVFKPV